MSGNQTEDQYDTAVISECGRYRYALERHIGGGCGNVLFVMLNPSTADASKDDPTIRRCKGFARRWGYSGLLVANLYAWRATDPDELAKAEDPVGPEWAYHVCSLAKRSGCIVAAWGSHASLHRQETVRDFLRQYNRVQCLGRTKNYSPKHPLYVKADTELQEYA